MEDPLILEFVNREDLPSAITSRDAALSTDASITRKSTTLRDACVALLRSIRSDTLQTGLAGQLETIAPQLERHITLQQKVQKWLLADEFDAIGTELFNISTRISRANKTIDRARICQLRVIAVLMLECGRQSSNDLSGALRLLRASVKTAKLCQEHLVLPLAQKILERAAMYQEELSKAPLSSSNDEVIAFASLRVDYYTARISLARIQENFQLAEYMIHKLTEKSLMTSLAKDKYLSVCELIFEYGTFHLRNKNTQAIIWLRICQELVFAREEEHFIDIRVNLIQNLARAYLLRNEEGDLDQVTTILEFAAEDYPVASWLYLLKIEYAAKRYPENAKPIATLLESMVRIVQITQPIFQSLIQKIHDLHKMNLELACKVLDLLLPKTAEADQLDWVERVLVTRIWIATQVDEDKHSSAIDSLRITFIGLEKKLTRDLSSKAIHASQILLWKICKGLCSHKKMAAALRWCLLARSPLFQNAGAANEAKIIRKIALCHLELGDYFAARDALAELPKASRDSALTWYIRFRVEIRNSSEEEVLSTIEALTKAEGFQSSMLYHCALEAQALSKTKVTLPLLMKIVDRARTLNEDSSVRMPALLRCIIKLCKNAIDQNPDVREDQLEMLCTQFEIAAKLVEEEESCVKYGFNVRELEWLSKTAHNIVLGAISKWPASFVLRLLNSCRALLGACSPTADLEARTDVQIRTLLATYLTLCTNLFFGRNELNDVKKAAYFRAVCTEAMSFRHGFQVLESTMGQAAKPEDLQSKLAPVLVFEFEARVNLSSWTELNSLIETANRYHLSSLPLSCMADLMLSSQAPAEASFSVIEALTNASLSSSDCDIKHLSRWLRMLFTISLSREPMFLDNFAPKLLEVIRDNLRTYPQDEIQWLAARAFNHAVDIHGTGNVDRCHRMCELALNIGNFAQDENLKVQIQENYQTIITSL